MAHHKAVAEKNSENKEGAAARTGDALKDQKQDADITELYLATELTSELRENRLLIAFKGLPMPEAMRKPSEHQAVVAFTFDSEQVHQFLELLIVKATQAQWHLPLDLPWLEPLNSSASAKTITH